MGSNFRNFIALTVSACIAIGLSTAGSVLADTDSALRELVAQNDKETRLAEYKDNETTLKLKLEVLSVINRNRANHGLPPVKLDILASRVASKASSEAVKGRYFGHWNLRGEKPYHRYAFAGGMDHVTENAAMRWSSLPMTRGYRDVLNFIIEAHMAMYNETPPNDGHRQNILNPWHTHVGLGFSLIENDFRYYEEYVDRYLEFDPLPESVKAGSEVKVGGRVAAPGYGAFFATVYYEPFPAPMTAIEAKGMGSYPDFTNSVAAQLPPWSLNYDNSTRSFGFSFKAARPGLYYVHIYVKKGHTGKEPPSSVSTRGLYPVSGIVVKAQ
jgi:uncharacterized protein YkwD